MEEREQKAFMWLRSDDEAETFVAVNVWKVTIVEEASPERALVWLSDGDKVSVRHRCRDIVQWVRGGRATATFVAVKAHEGSSAHIDALAVTKVEAIGDDSVLWLVGGSSFKARVDAHLLVASLEFALGGRA